MTNRVSDRGLIQYQKIAQEIISGQKHTLILNSAPEEKIEASNNIADDLMLIINELKARYFDLYLGRVDYHAIKSAPEYVHYKELASQLNTYDPADMATLEERLAFWINLYNVIVIHGIIETDIKTSVWEAGNFFSKVSYAIGGQLFSADDIEHGILRANARPPYRPFSCFRKNDPRAELSLEKIDPRIHFALVCGSQSCPPIRFYDKEEIDIQLDLAADNFINSSEVVIMPEKNEILLSRIFKWYKNDYGGRKNMIGYLLKHLKADYKTEYLRNNPGRIKIGYLPYDWNLNH